jgi:hypothetical protein
MGEAVGFREWYFEQLDFDPSKEKEKLQSALNRAYEQRTFEIEHYWKRATYFWGFQIAIFATFGLVWKEQNDLGGRGMLIALTIIGLLTAVANLLSSQGSKFWQQNWENHIDMLEDRLEGRLYKTVWLDGERVSFSVSRINSMLNICFVAFWVFALAYISWRFLIAHSLVEPPERFYIGWILAPLALSLLGVALLYCQKTSFRGVRTTVRGTEERVWEESCDPKEVSFVRRFPPNVAEETKQTKEV